MYGNAVRTEHILVVRRTKAASSSTTSARWIQPADDARLSGVPDNAVHPSGRVLERPPSALSFVIGRRVRGVGTVAVRDRLSVAMENPAL